MQHYDAVFYPDDPYARQAAIEACCLPMRRIANSTWLAELLKERHGLRDAALAFPAIDHEVFRPGPRAARGDGPPGGFRLVARGRAAAGHGVADLLQAR